MLVSRVCRGGSEAPPVPFLHARVPGFAAAAPSVPCPVFACLIRRGAGPRARPNLTC